MAFGIVLVFCLVSIFIHFWLHRVTECSLFTAAGRLLSSCGAWAPELPGSAAAARGLSCPTVCGICLDQGLTPCPLHCKAESQPVDFSIQGSPPGYSCFGHQLRLWPYPSCPPQKLFIPDSGPQAVECSQPQPWHHPAPLASIKAKEHPCWEHHGIWKWKERPPRATGQHLVSKGRKSDSGTTTLGRQYILLHGVEECRSRPPYPNSRSYWTKVRYSWPFQTHAHVLCRFSRVWLFATLWTGARQTSLSKGILQARILEWVAMPSSGGIFPTQGLNPCLLPSRQILYHWATGEAPFQTHEPINHLCHHLPTHPSQAFAPVSTLKILIECHLPTVNYNTSHGLRLPPRKSSGDNHMT